MIRKIKPEHEEKMEKSKLKEILDRHEEVFAQKLGHMPIKAHLNLKEGTRPVWKKAQPVPHALYPLVDAELERWLGNPSGSSTEGRWMGKARRGLQSNGESTTGDSKVPTTLPRRAVCEDKGKKDLQSWI